MADFFIEGKSSDDAYPIFREMLKQNISAHYMDERKSLYEHYCKNEKKCLKIIPIYNKKYKLDGDFFEKYLDMILKLKAVISVVDFISFHNIFMYIDYITYINLGHGVKYFKHFLYKDFSSHTKFNKLLLLPSNRIISMAKKYGWSDNNIIKICLPKWDKYNFNINDKIKFTYSIFVMFTWRMMKNNKYNISSFYLKNILEFINNDNLNIELKKKNIILYFCLHHMFAKYKDKIKMNQNIQYVNETQIFNVLNKINLLITDFSSVIFDIIYQNKPYIIFLPDADDPNIETIYNQGYFDIINGLKNGSIYFENIYRNITKAINIQKFIDYLKYN